MNTNLPTSVPSEPLNVLVVDDEPAMRQGIRLVLSDYNVLEAGSVEESLALFDRHEPVLVTLDINMPDINGIEGLDYFRRRSPRLPIILISGERSFEVAREALRLGATDYLTKPFLAHELRRSVKAALEKVFTEDDEGPDDPHDFVRNFKLRLPLENVLENHFLSTQHRSRFLAFAQNVLSDRQRMFERISMRELAKTIKIQLDSLRLDDSYRIVSACDSLILSCEMYLLGGALANLLLTCIQKTQADPGPVRIFFESDANEVRIIYRKADLVLPEETLTCFAHWRRHRHALLDADSAMLVLAQKVASFHKGEMHVNTEPKEGYLVEIRIPLQPTL